MSCLPGPQVEGATVTSPGFQAPRACCPFKGMAYTGYWRVGAAELGNDLKAQFGVNCSGILAMGFLQALHSLAEVLGLTHSPSEEHCPVEPLLLPPHLPTPQDWGTRPEGRLRGVFLCLGTPLPPGLPEEGREGELDMVGEGLSLEIQC